MENFWSDSDKLHINAWREVNTVESYQVTVQPKSGSEDKTINPENKLFFINLGGYKPSKFEEQHYMLLTVKATGRQP